MTQRIKVLQLISTLSVGGAERLLLGLAERIDRERFEVHICGLSVLRGNKLQPAFEHLGVPIHIIGAARFYDPKAFWRVARYVREQKIDLVHTHLTHADVVGRIAGYCLGRPLISTLQNEPRDYNRQRADYRFLQRFTDRLFKPQLITVSHRIRSMFIQEWHIPAERICMIYNAIPMERYLPIAEGTPQRSVDEGPVVTNIGRLGPQKAQHHLLNAARLVLAQRPDTRFMIIGQGRLEQPLKQQAQSLGIADRVMFTGLRNDIPELLAQSDIFVLPSLWEGLPLTAVEAMAAARPVVLTDVGGNRELVDSGVQGLIVPPGDEPALADALLALLNDEAQRIAMGRAARERVQHEFSIDVIAAQHEALYEDIWRKHYAKAKRSRASTAS